MATYFLTSSMSSPSLLKYPETNSMAAIGFLSHSSKSHLVRSVAAPSETTTGFDEMVSGTKRKYYMLGGKGVVGKTSCAASLAVKFANSGHPTLVVSTDPAHSLSDSFAQINPEKAREEFRSASQKNGGTGIKDFMDGMGLGMIVDQLGELKLGELLDTPPPGLDEAIAISKLKQKIASATSAIKSVFGQEGTQQDAADKLERLRERMVKVRELFRDTDSTEFVIVTIPTVMAVSESSKLRASLKKENVPVKRLIVNQILPPSASDCIFCAMKRKDQTRALDMIRSGPEFLDLTLIQAPLVDVEIRGVPALKFLGDIVWK
ncbi:Arsenical pump-driving ATPase [Actinidia chinensis var. chinensis]|uniref:Arsenical pump-driving ATPase n=1 Tax=Actinidia chinensis var. chinensis TaxID=1590841 RepID=A0A2R6RTT5_ACTCC|nr:Arsenical pump-driving ATPase [Actinidia chinensis var. chinensis]